MAIVIKEIDVKTTVEKNRAEITSEDITRQIKEEIKQEIQQGIEQRMKVDMERLRQEHRTVR